MIVKVLGSAAGGGFPQWNCQCPNCADLRRGLVGLTPRTQSSIAVSLTGKSWILLNASPDLRAQILQTPELSPRGEDLRHSPITAVVLTNGDVDHLAGLFCLREGHAFELFASASILETVSANSVFGVLDPVLVRRTTLHLGRKVPFREPDTAGQIEIEAFAVPGKVALYLERVANDAKADSTVGLEISDGGSSVFYVPGCARMDARLVAKFRDAALVIFDGTLYEDDEMITLGLSQKTGQRMGHMSMSGPDGSIAAFRALGVKRKIFIHINNSNPVLRDGSPERLAVNSAGWEIAYDGMEVRL